MKRKILALMLGATAVTATAAPVRYSDYSPPDAAEIDSLTYMREEEKLARDVYRTLLERWNAVIFENIAASEQQHTDSVAALLDKYRLTDPVIQDIPGLFVNPDLQALYDALVFHGGTSLEAGLHVGAFIEETDIRDLAAAIAATDNGDIERVYENLLKGSRNHLRAFVGALEEIGVVYEAKVLSQEELDAIVDSPMERGR